MSEKKLFAEFPPVTRQQWVDKAIQDLKGADFNKKLVWNTYEGFSVQPFYTAEDVEPIREFTEYVRSVQRSDAGWIAYAEVAAADTGKQAADVTEVLQQGTEGLYIEVNNPEEFAFSTVLAAVNPAAMHIAFKLSAPSADFVKAYFAYLESRQIDLTSVRGFVECDSLGQRITGTITSVDYSALAKQVQATEGIRTQEVCDAGGNMTQELAFAMNKLVQYAEGLTSKGLTVQQIFSNVMFQAGITGDFFFEIAKLRVLRALFTTVAAHYNIAYRPVYIFSMSSLWSKSLFDAYTNMLRNTTEGLSAVAGGCDALLIKPHNHRHETFSNRMAVNISHILRAESYVDQVADVAEGSYYLEAITFALYENALNLFKEIESAGGYETAADQGIIQDKIKALRERKLQDVATRKQVYVGVNQYADPAEVLPFTELPADQKSGILTPQRATRAFEELRLHTLQLVKTTGKTAEVYLAAFGNLAMRKARVAFAQNFFAAAGFQTTEYYHENLLVGLPSITGSQAGIVVLCSSDEDYAQQAEEFAKTFRQQAKGKILVLAGYPPDQVDKLRAAGIDQFIHIRSNAVEVLIGLQQQVFNGKQRV